MAQKTIPDLVEANTPDGSELLLVNQGGFTRKLPINSLVGAWTSSAGAQLSPVKLKEWVLNGSFALTDPETNDNDIVTAGTVEWPDGSLGTFTATLLNNDWSAVDAYRITHDDSGQRVVQAAVTRDPDTGEIETRPALTVEAI